MDAYRDLLYKALSDACPCDAGVAVFGWCVTRAVLERTPDEQN
jgi:hypothetical protein